MSSDAQATLKQRRYFWALSGIAAALEKEYTAREIGRMITQSLFTGQTGVFYSLGNRFVLVLVSIALLIFSAVFGKNGDSNSPTFFKI